MNNGRAMQHVAIYLPSLRGGGAERVIVTLANAFSERGLKVDLVLAKAEGPYLKDVSSAVRVIDLKAGRVIRSLPGLISYLRSNRPQAMLTALNHANVVAILARVLAFAPTRIVVSEHNTPTIAAASTALSISSCVVRTLMRWLYPQADGIVAVSNGVADDLSRFANIPRQRISTVYNPFEVSDIQRQAAMPTDHPWFAPGEPPVVLGIGRLTAQKDFSILIRAFNYLKNNWPMRLMILGEGELRDELQTLADSLQLSPDTFLLPGFVDNPFAYLSRCSVFVLSSRWEGLPSVLIEALACGVPVISTNCPSGPFEILENGKWGRLVPIGDVDALATAIAETLDESEHPDVVKRAADFSVNRAVDAYLNVLFQKA